MKTCNQTEQSKVKSFVVLWKHVMQNENETPILSCILWKTFKALYSTQLFKIRTLFFHDNVTGHTLVTLGKGRRVSELCSRKAECSHARSHVSCVVLTFWREKAHGMPFGAWKFGEKGRCVAQPQQERCRLADFWRKRKSCGATSLPFFTTRRKRKVGGATSARKSADSRIFGKKGNCVARPPEILYLFVYQYRLNAPMGEVNRQ